MDRDGDPAAIISDGFGLAAQYLPIIAAEEQLIFKQPEAAVSDGALSHAGN
ncbi:MAG TPA: hypothetical protein VF819_08335 [Nitrospira sp.]|jgi:hypothetical protein